MTKMETILKTEREQHENEMKKMETRLTTEREKHLMKKMDVKNGGL